MTLSHFYRANLSPRQLQRATDEAAMLYPDVAPHEHAVFLEIADSGVHQEGLDLVMSVRMGELRRERGFFVDD